MEELLRRYPALSVCKAEITEALEAMTEAFECGGKLLLCGNGGSCADCDHIAGELLKGFLSKRPADEETVRNLTAQYPKEGPDLAKKLQRGLPAISLAAHAGVMTAFANDVDPELIYAQLVYAYGKTEDVVLGISTSGNSKNVVAALRTAKALGLKTVGLTGSRESAMDSICDVIVKVPETETYKVQEYHLPVYHYLCAALEERFFGAD